MATPSFCESDEPATQPPSPRAQADGSPPKPVENRLRRSNVAVPVGSLIVIASFFLPWFHLQSDLAGLRQTQANHGLSRTESASGYELAFHTKTAGALLGHFGLRTDNPTQITCRLALFPVMAAGALLLNLTVGRGAFVRIASRMLIFATGVFLTLVFGYMGSCCPQLHPTPAFWMTFSGGLLIAVGTVFDIFRGA